MKPNRPVGSGSGTYYDLAIAHIRAHGGEGVVLEREKLADREQWRAWLGYFAWLDGLTSPPGHKAAKHQSLRQITVPAAWPIEFDASAPPPPARPEPREEFPSPARRRELAAMLRGLVAGWEATAPPGTRVSLRAPRSPGEAEVSRRAHEGRLDNLKAEYAANPVGLSFEALAAIKPPE